VEKSNNACEGKNRTENHYLEVHYPQDTKWVCPEKIRKKLPGHEITAHKKKIFVEITT